EGTCLCSSQCVTACVRRRPHHLPKARSPDRIWNLHSSRVSKSSDQGKPWGKATEGVLVYRGCRGILADRRVPPTLCGRTSRKPHRLRYRLGRGCAGNAAGLRMPSILVEPGRGGTRSGVKSQGCTRVFDSLLQMLSPGELSNKNRVTWVLFPQSLSLSMRHSCQTRRGIRKRTKSIRRGETRKTVIRIRSAASDQVKASSHARLTCCVGDISGFQYLDSVEVSRDSASDDSCFDYVTVLGVNGVIEFQGAEVARRAVPPHDRNVLVPWFGVP